MAVVDLARLPPPDVVEQLDYDDILAALTADLRGRSPEYSAWVESEPALKLLEVAAYRELLLRHRINTAARHVMLAFAGGSDLDHLAALFGVVRAAGETDARMLSRVQTALSGLSTAGSRAAYIHHALSSDPRVRDVCVTRFDSRPGRVRITVLGEHPDGAASASLIAVVAAALTADTVRPLTDVVQVRPADIVPYTISATLTIESGPDPDVVLAAARTAAEGYVRARNHCGADIHRAAIIAALVVPGVTNVALTAPAADLGIRGYEAPWCTASATVAYRGPTTHPLDGITLTAA